ncbi:uncharacterized protein ACN427_005134 isoform 1-T1 [Glossina fuscipes fuscipes]
MLLDKVVNSLLFLISLYRLPVSAKLPLIFPPTSPTRTQFMNALQWLAGIGIPLEDLDYEALTTGYVLKAEYFLPYDVEQLKQQTPLPITVRKLNNQMTTSKHFLTAVNELAVNSTATVSSKRNQNYRSSYRWAMYKGLEILTQRLGLGGRDCVMKSICEVAEAPFHYYNGLFAELFYILLTPSSSTDKISTYKDNEYFQAEYLGRSGANCHLAFSSCPKSLLACITKVQKLTEDLIEYLG